MYFTAEMQCPKGYKVNPFSKTCIKLVNLKKTWDDAKNYCEVNGEYLATFETTDSATWLAYQRQSDPGKNKQNHKI